MLAPLPSGCPKGARALYRHVSKQDGAEKWLRVSAPFRVRTCVRHLDSWGQETDRDFVTHWYDWKGENPVPQEVVLSASGFAAGDWGKKLRWFPKHPLAAQALGMGIEMWGAEVEQDVSAPRWMGQLLQLPANPEYASVSLEASSDPAAEGACRQLVELGRRNPKLGLTIGAAVGGIFSWPLGRDPYTLHLWGAESSQGKTTALRCAAQVVGVPFHEGASTANAILSHLSSVGCLPGVFDEINVRIRRVEDRVDLIFTVSGGATKMRGKRDGGHYTSNRWNSVLITSANGRVAPRGGSMGLRARLVEVSAPVIGDRCSSKEEAGHEAKLVESLGEEAHGWALSKISREESRWTEATREALQALPGPFQSVGGVEGRTAAHLASAVAGWATFCQMLGEEKGSEVEDCAMDVMRENQEEKAEEGETAWDILLEAVRQDLASDPASYPSWDRQFPEEARNQRGVWSEDGYELRVFTWGMDRICEVAGIEDPRGALLQGAARGQLRKEEKGRLSMRVRTRTGRVRAYVFPREFLERDDGGGAESQRPSDRNSVPECYASAGEGTATAAEELHGERSTAGMIALLLRAETEEELRELADYMKADVEALPAGPREEIRAAYLGKLRGLRSIQSPPPAETEETEEVRHNNHGLERGSFETFATDGISVYGPGEAWGTPPLGLSDLVEEVRQRAGGKSAVLWVHESAHGKLGLPEKREQGIVVMPAPWRPVGERGWHVAGGAGGQRVHVAFPAWGCDFRGCAGAEDLLEQVTMFQDAVGWQYLYSAPATIRSLILGVARKPAPVVEPLSSAGWRDVAFQTPATTWVSPQPQGKPWVRLFDRVAAYLSPWEGADLPVGEWRHEDGMELRPGPEPRRPTGYWRPAPGEVSRIWPASLPPFVQEAEGFLTTPMIHLLAEMGGGVRVQEAWIAPERWRFLARAAKRLRAAREHLQDYPQALDVLKDGYAGGLAWLEFGPQEGVFHRPSWRRTVLGRFWASTSRHLLETPALAYGDVDTAAFAVSDPEEVPGGLRVDGRLGSWKPKGRAVPMEAALEALQEGRMAALIRLARHDS